MDHDRDAHVRNAQLEARLIETPDDDELYLAYADYLQAQGDPRGEVIAAEHAGQLAHAAKLYKQHADHLFGPLADIVACLDIVDGAFALGWHRGFVRSALLSNHDYVEHLNADRIDEYHDRLEQWLSQWHDGIPIDAGPHPSRPEPRARVSPADAVEHLLSHPSGALLHTLMVPCVAVGGYNELVATLGRLGAPCLRELQLGVAHGDQRFATISHFGDIEPIWRALPRVERVSFVGYVGETEGQTSRLGEIAAPQLTHLRVGSLGLSSDNMQSIARAALPNVEYLDIWFGWDELGWDASVEDLAPLLRGDQLPRLRSLLLLMAHHGDEVCAAVAGSALLPRLRRLSLASGTISDRGVEALLSQRESFAHLELLDLEHNYLSADAAAAVAELCDDVRTGLQREIRDDMVEAYPDTGGRFVGPRERYDSPFHHEAHRL